MVTANGTACCPLHTPAHQPTVNRRRRPHHRQLHAVASEEGDAEMTQFIEDNLLRPQAQEVGGGVGWATDVQLCDSSVRIVA